MSSATFPTDKQAAEAVVPGVGSLDDPPSRFAAHAPDKRLLSAATDVRTDTAKPNCGGDVRVVVALVETHVRGATRATRTADGDSVEDLADHRCVRHVGTGDERCDRDAACVGENMALYAAFRPVRRVRTREVPPFGAFTEALSRELHSQSMPRLPS
jgi:hypothetical protein